MLFWCAPPGCFLAGVFPFPGVFCTKRHKKSEGLDDYQLHCMICKSGGGVDQRHSALARCLADLITTHTGTTAYIEQSLPGHTHTNSNGQTELARMDIVVALRGITYYIDTAIVSPFLL